MRRFRVEQAEHPVTAAPRFRVVDTQEDLIVATFDTVQEAQEHADKLEAGPLDWDEQEAWQDDDDDWGTWEKWD
jgi:hypothetical protein